MPDGKTSTPWSYHTFILPFVARQLGGDSGTRLIPCRFDVTGASPDSLVKAREKSDGHGVILLKDAWKPISWHEDDPKNDNSRRIDRLPRRIREANSEKNVTLAYNAFQYFTEPARKLVFGLTKGDDYLPLVQHFDLRPNNEDLRKCGGKYVIEWAKTEKDVKSVRKYELDLVRVRLMSYSTFVSFLVLETENHGDHSLEDIERINEYGRRVCFPFLSFKPKGEHPVVADFVRITGLPDWKTEDYTQDNVYDDVGDHWWQEKQDGRKDGGLSLRHLMNPLKGLLSEWTKDREATSSLVHLDQCPDKRFLVTPVMDDRMFVCCLYRNDELSEKMKAWSSEHGNYRIFSSSQVDDQLANDVYAFTFVDIGSPTCQSRTKRSDLLRKVIDDRWINWGTLYAATDHSFMCLTSENIDDTEATVLRPFSNIYLRLVIMVILQKASILEMSAKAADLANGFGSDKHNDEEIAELQKRNAIVQNQIVLSEVTTQEQGVELFTLLRERLGVEAINAELTEQLSYLYQMSSTAARQEDDDQEREFHRIVAIVGIFLGGIACISTLVDIQGLWPDQMYVCWLRVILTVAGWLAPILLLFVCLWCLVKWRRSKFTKSHRQT